jgi:hypothetical protein
MKQQTQTGLDLHQKVRDVEQEAYRAMMEAAKRHIDRLGQQPQASTQEFYLAHAQSQFDYEREVWRAYMDAQAKLRAIAAERLFGEQNGAAVTQQFTNQQQDAYQAYLADLQQAWSGTKTLDPQIMSAIASNIMCAMNPWF